MKKRITVITKDRFLYQKIYLALKGDYIIADFGDAEYSEGDTVILDIDGFDDDGYYRADITVGYDKGSLRRPFSEGELRAALENNGSESAMLSVGEKSVYLRGEKIKLTEVEFLLLSRLIAGGGEFVSRNTLLTDVWGEGFDGGVLNVYIHYLREKLEVGGEKIIVSSRKNGYKIDEKYLKGGYE